MFSCKSCKDKDKEVSRLRALLDESYTLRIASAEAEIGRLMAILNPPKQEVYKHTMIEANAILNGVDEQIEIPETADVAQERDALLSGTY